MNLIVVLLALVFLGAQTPPAKPFVATAQLAVPYTLGLQEVIQGSNKAIDTGTLRVLTVASARLATTYPNKSENVWAGAGEKLLIVRGALQNPGAMVLPTGSDHFLSIRFWDGKGAGEFKYVGIYDPETHEWVHSNLSKGQSAPFECVIRVPAGFNSFRVGFYHQYPARTAWYDFTPVLGKLTSAFSPDGLTLADHAQVSSNQAFDFDMFEMKVLGASEPAAIGGVARGDRPLTVVSVEVTNAMMLPARWGWQHVTPELVMKDGTVLAGAGDLIDKATDATWSGDVAAGKTMIAQFVFRPEKGQVPGAFRLTIPSTRRSIDVSF